MHTGNGWKWGLLLCATVLWAQDKPKPARFAVRISDSNESPVDVRNVAEQPEARQTLMWRGPAFRGRLTADGFDPPAIEISAFSLSFQTDGDAVRVKAEGYHASSAAILPGPDRGLTESLDRLTPETISTAVLHVNESATFSEMARFHLQPLMVKIVPAQRSAPSLFTAQSKARSPIPSA